MILDMLKSYKQKNRISFAMPGHKGGVGLMSDFSSFGLDVTELSDTDNLLNPKESVKQAKKALSDFFGSADTFFLVNGSTGGIHTMLVSVCDFGDTVLISRTCHSSVINACSLFGINPVFIEQEILGEFDIPKGVNPQKLAELIKAYKPKAVLITSPNYFGICSDLSEIARIVHSYNIPLLVDEAHGAHFCTDKNIFPKSAMMSGADMSVQSAHKTLNSPNQTALLHYNSNIIDYERVKKVYGMLQTSSPSYLLCAACECAVSELSTTGIDKWRRLYCNVSLLKENLSAYYKILDKTEKADISDLDKTRIVINLCDYDCTGFEISQILTKEYNIDIEMADLKNLVLIPTPANSNSDFECLYNALINIHKTLKPTKNTYNSLSLPEPVGVISPYQAFHSPQKAYPLCDSLNKISATTVVSYPPAIPVVLPGFKITEEVIEYIEKMQETGAEITGLGDNNTISVADI